MTRVELLGRVELWRERLIPEWRITVMDHPPEDWDTDNLATIQADEDYQHAKVYFTDKCLARDEKSIDVTIVHELLHQVMREMRRVIDEFQGEVGFRVHSGACDRFRSAEERAVDRLSHLIVHAASGEWPAFGTMPNLDRAA